MDASLLLKNSFIILNIAEELSLNEIFSTQYESDIRRLVLEFGKQNSNFDQIRPLHTRCQNIEQRFLNEYRDFEESKLVWNTPIDPYFRFSTKRFLRILKSIYQTIEVIDSAQYYRDPIHLQLFVEVKTFLQHALQVSDAFFINGKCIVEDLPKYYASISFPKTANPHISTAIQDFESLHELLKLLGSMTKNSDFQPQIIKISTSDIQILIQLDMEFLLVFARICFDCAKAYKEIARYEQALKTLDEMVQDGSKGVDKDEKLKELIDSRAEESAKGKEKEKIPNPRTENEIKTAWKNIFMRILKSMRSKVRFQIFVDLNEAENSGADTDKSGIIEQLRMLEYEKQRVEPEDDLPLILEAPHLIERRK